MGYYNEKTKVYEVYPREVTTMREWLTNRGGLAIWECLDLSDPGKTWTTPALSKDGKPTERPHWAAGKVIATVTDIDKVVVTVPKEVKRFHVATRMGANGLKIKLTDASGRKVRAAEEKAGPEAWHEFDYECQDAIIYVPGEKVLLKDWEGPGGRGCEGRQGVSICHRCGNHELGTDCTIPKSPFYVTSTDSFMSGWGHATSKKNICVVPCSTREMAERVLRYVKSRSEQKNAKITTYRPGEGPTVLLTNLAEWIKTAKRNGF